MLRGEIYCAGCEELLKEREFVKDLCYEYNNLKPSKEIERKELLKKF